MSKIFRAIALFVASYITSFIATIIVSPIIVAMPFGLWNITHESQRVPNTHYVISEIGPPRICYLDRVPSKRVEDTIAGIKEGVYYNDKYIVGFKSGYIEPEAFFIIIFQEGYGAQDDCLLYEHRSDFLSALDSLNINLLEMKLKRLTYYFPYYPFIKQY